MGKGFYVSQTLKTKEWKFLKRMKFKKQKEEAKIEKGTTNKTEGFYCCCK